MPGVPVSWPRVITLNRRSKKQPAAVAVASTWAGTTGRCAAYAICRAGTLGYSRIGSAAGRVPPLRQGETGTAESLADNPLYTKRFAYYVGRRCRQATIKDVADELALDWHTVKALDQHTWKRSSSALARLVRR